MVPLWSNKHRHFALFGGRGGAKSHGIANAIIAHSSQRNERVVCGRQFQNSIRDSSKALLEAKIRDMGLSGSWSSTERELVNSSTKSRITFIGMDRNPDSAKSLEGATIFWGEEAQTFTKRSIELIIPTLRAKGSRLYWSWNPRYTDDPIDAFFRGQTPPSRSYIRAVGYQDNPWFYQTEMPQEMADMRRTNPKRCEHVWGGAYDENPDGLILPNHEIGRPEYIPQKCYPRFGIDFGFASDATALVKSYLIPEISCIYIAQEAHGHGIPTRDLPALMDQVTESRDWPIIGDSSRPETIEALCHAGFNVMGSRKGAGSVRDGLTWMQGYKLLIDPRCTQTAYEVKRYKWKEDRNGRIMPTPDGRCEDHCIDALRYAHEDDSILSMREDDGVDYVRI